MAPVLIPKVQKMVQVEKERVIREQVANWLIGFTSGKLETQYFNGKKIVYSGIKFSGSPRDIFWGRYIEPYLEDITERLIKEVSQDCAFNNLNLAEELQPLAESLKSLYLCVFDEMAKVEQRLLGKGYPSRVSKRNVTRKVANMNSYLKQYINMEIEKQKPRLHSPESKIKKRIQRIWHDPVWSKIIAAALIGLIAYFYNHPELFRNLSNLFLK